jgi:hypothetical protein
MHTFLKRGDGTFEIGTWNVGPHGHAQFDPIFKVSGIVETLRLINFLNGGPGAAREWIKGILAGATTDV